MRNRNTKKILAALGWLLLAALGASPAPAAGLRTKFGEVIVRGLKIGQSYSLDKLLNLPLRVLNTGEQTQDLRIDVVSAAPEVLKNGYELIPSTSWITLAKQDFLVEPNHEAVTDVVIAIPNDPSLLGRRFQADIWTRTTGRVGVLGVGMQSRLLIQIDSTPPTAEELKRKFVDRRVANMDFTLFPAACSADDLPVGRPVNLRQERKCSVKIINPNEQTLHFRIRSVPNWEALLAVPAGFEDAWEARWLKPAEEIVKVEGNSIKDTALQLEIPRRDNVGGRHFVFAVEVELLEQEIPARVFYKLLASTRKAEEKK